MSQLIRTSNEKDVASTEQRQAVIKSKANNILQWSKPVTATTKNIGPGTSTQITVNFNSPYFEQEVGHYVQCIVANAHATATLTLKNGPLNIFDSVTLIPNASNYKIELKKIAQIKEIISEYYLNMGLNIYEDSSFVRNEFTTFSGIAIGPASEVQVYYPLDPFLSFAGTCVKDEIRQLQIELQCTATPANATVAGRCFLSSTTANLWTEANVQLKNIAYVRNFFMIQNPAQLVKMFASIPKELPLRHVNWRVEEKVLRTGSWNVGDSWNGKLSDIYKNDLIQHISFVVRPIASNYNDAECCKEYSGYNYIGWKWSTLGRGGDERALDMTDKRFLRDFELRQYRNEFGRKQLPLEILTDSTNLFTKYFLRMTRINFDYMQVENTHEVIRFTNSNLQDYDITVNANGNAGSNCELVAFTAVAEPFDWNKQNGQLYPSVL
jgi:hypothetical protein